MTFNKKTWYWAAFALPWLFVADAAPARQSNLQQVSESPGTSGTSRFIFNGQAGPFNGYPDPNSNSPSGRLQVEDEESFQGAKGIVQVKASGQAFPGVVLATADVTAGGRDNADGSVTGGAYADASGSQYVVVRVLQPAEAPQGTEELALRGNLAVGVGFGGGSEATVKIQNLNTGKTWVWVRLDPFNLDGFYQTPQGQHPIDDNDDFCSFDNLIDN